MDRAGAQRLIFLSLAVLLAGVPQVSRSIPQEEYDLIVDVTNMPGKKACRRMQAALNDALTGRGPAKRVLFKGSLGSQDHPVDFSMFRNHGMQGAGKKPWPYSVCHAFWPIVNSERGEGVVAGYPDPLFPTVIKQAPARVSSDRATVAFQDPICQSFSLGRKRVFIASGKGEGQMRRISSCSSANLATLDREWDTAPDSTSIVQVLDWRNPRAHEIRLRVEYDLEIYYENSEVQGLGEYGVFADVGLHCYFMGASEDGQTHRGCLSHIPDGIERTGRISVHERGQRDDGQDCRPTWPDTDRLMNRGYSVIWQALGPGVKRGMDDTELRIFGSGDRDNVGVLLFQTWTKTFRRWRISGMGTAIWISGSLNNSLEESYIALNDFGVVTGSNEDWGTGWPRSQDCFTGNCKPTPNSTTGLNIRGGVIEGNKCGNFVMFGGYYGEVDRTFVETGGKGASTYEGHSVLVGAGVCDVRSAPSRRQNADRSGMVCGDDDDCGGICIVNSKAKRAYGFTWDAVLASNRGDPRWYAFMLGKGTGAKYLESPLHSARPIRVTGGGFGGEFGHGNPPLDFHPSPGSAVGIDVATAWAGAPGTRLPAYDHYVATPFESLDARLRKPRSGIYQLGTLMRNTTCTRASIFMEDGKVVVGRWSIRYGPRQGAKGVELFEGGRPLPRRGEVDIVTANDLDSPYVPAKSFVWLVLEDVIGIPAVVHVEVQCMRGG